MRAEPQFKHFTAQLAFGKSCACTESCVYACRTLKTGDAAQLKGSSVGFVPI